MAKIEDDSLEFENLDLSAEEVIDEQVIAEPSGSESEVVEIDADLLAGLPPVEEAPPSKPEPVAEPEPREEPAPKAVREKSGSSSQLVPMAVAVGLPVILLGLAAVGFLLFSTAIYLTAVGCTFVGLWICRKNNTVYAVMLACALAALMTAVYCFWIELGRYEFDVKAKKAKEAKQRISAVWPHSIAERLS